MFFSVLKCLPDFHTYSNSLLKFPTFHSIYVYFITIKLSGILSLAPYYLSLPQPQDLRNVWGEVMQVDHAFMADPSLSMILSPGHCEILEDFILPFRMPWSSPSASHAVQELSRYVIWKINHVCHCLLYPKIHLGQEQSSASTHSQKRQPEKETLAIISPCWKVSPVYKF